MNKTSRTIVITAIATALLAVSKYALSFVAGLEVFTFLIFVFSACIGLRKSLVAVLACIVIDIAFWGIAPWLLMYLLHFPLVAVVGKLCVRISFGKARDLYIALIMAGVTVLFCFQTTFIEHLLYEYAFWPRFVLGLPAFLLNIVTNFALGLFAYSPVTNALSKLSLLNNDRLL